jgi:hypothetical protein
MLGLTVAEDLLMILAAAPGAREGEVLGTAWEGRTDLPTLEAPTAEGLATAGATDAGLAVLGFREGEETVGVVLGAAPPVGGTLEGT